MIFLKNIFNWLGSGFFRKLGSILCYLIIGTLLIAFLSSKDIKLPKLFNHMYVNAATSQSATYKFQIRSACTPETGYEVSTSLINRDGYVSPWTYLIPGDNIGCTYGKNLQRSYFRVTSSGNMTTGRFYTLTYKQVIDCSQLTCVFIPASPSDWKYEISGNNGNGWDYRFNYATCETRKIEDQYQYLTTCIFSPRENLTEIVINTFFSGQVNNTRMGIRDVTKFTTSNGALSYETDSTGAINNQTQVLKQQTDKIINNLDEINITLDSGFSALQDTINNTNVNESSLLTNNFLNNFTSQSDSFLINLIQLPFNFLNSLVLGSEEDLCFTLKGVTSCFPNGQKTIWNKDFTGHSSLFSGVVNNTSRDTFKLFFNLVCAGILSYKMILMLIRKVHDWLMPDKSVVEVMDL